MELLDYSTAIDRLRAAGLAFLTEPVWEDKVPTAAYRIPKDTGRKTWIAQTLVRSIFGGRGIIFGITEHGVFPSCEIENLFIDYRSSFAQKKTLFEAPFHFATANEGEYVEGMLALSLYFFWDAVIASETDNVFARISHDEWIEIATKSPDRLLDICEFFEEAGMKRI